MSNQISLEELFNIIKTKISAKDSDSYSYKLSNQGVEKITRKIGEEALEVVIAAFLDDKNQSQKTREELIGEICDLFYHSLVLMAHKNINFSEILEELNHRNKKHS